MKSLVLGGWVVAACMGAPLAASAANGSIAAEMVKHAQLRRLEAQQRAGQPGCERQPHTGFIVCSTRAEPQKEKVRKT